MSCEGCPWTEPIARAKQPNSPSIASNLPAYCSDCYHFIDTLANVVSHLLHGPIFVHRDISRSSSDHEVAFFDLVHMFHHARSDSRSCCLQSHAEASRSTVSSWVSASFAGRRSSAPRWRSEAQQLPPSTTLDLLSDFQELTVKVFTISLSGSSVHDAKRGTSALQFAANGSTVMSQPCFYRNSPLVDDGCSCSRRTGRFHDTLGPLTLRRPRPQSFEFLGHAGTSGSPLIPALPMSCTLSLPAASLAVTENPSALPAPQEGNHRQTGFSVLQRRADFETGA